ncbi:MAG: hypothetical protein ABIO02_00640, partial [Patescibacteria group bacterium]
TTARQRVEANVPSLRMWEHFIKEPQQSPTEPDKRYLDPMDTFIFLHSGVIQRLVEEEKQE